jgi:glucose/arabinose dehydrogenase
MDEPFMVWVPSIALSGMTFYTSDKIEKWKGNIFVGGRRGTQLQRIVLNAKGLPVVREPLLLELKQRIAEVRQGPDGLLYLLTDESAGALLRIEPVSADRPTTAGSASNQR